MARNEQLIRQHKLLQVLERSRFGQTLDEIRDELVEELGLTSLHTRSVRRDIEALQAAGFHLSSEQLERGRVWKLGQQSRTPYEITVSATELLALSLGRDLLLPLAGTPFWQGIETFWHKIQEQLPGSIWDHYQRFRRVLHVSGMPAKSYEEQQGTLKTLNRAILQHRVVQIEYQSLGKPVSTRRILPYAIVFYQSSLYIIAAEQSAEDSEQALRHWKLDRFLGAEALDDYFTADQEFDLTQYLGQSLGIFSQQGLEEFQVRISAFAAPWVIEDPWHADQKVERQEDGSVLLTVRATHELEVIPRVLALGTEAELLSPPASRQRLQEIISELQGTYSDGGSSTVDSDPPSSS
jgi:predicted DNA-binding transcriptional regulator YafY